MTGPLLPQLFQRKIGWRREIIGTKVPYRLLSETPHRDVLLIERRSTITGGEVATVVRAPDQG